MPYIPHVPHIPQLRSPTNSHSGCGDNCMITENKQGDLRFLQPKPCVRCRRILPYEVMSKDRSGLCLGCIQDLHQKSMQEEMMAARERNNPHCNHCGEVYEIPLMQLSLLPSQRSVIICKRCQKRVDSSW